MTIDYDEINNIIHNRTIYKNDFVRVFAGLLS